MKTPVNEKTETYRVIVASKIVQYAIVKRSKYQIKK